MLGQKNMLTIVESKEHGENVCQTLFVAVPFFVLLLLLLLLLPTQFRSIGRSIKHSSKKTKVLFFSNYKYPSYTQNRQAKVRLQKFGLSCLFASFYMLNPSATLTLSNL